MSMYISLCMFYQAVLCMVEQDGRLVEVKGKNGEICSAQGNEIRLAIHLLDLVIATTHTHTHKLTHPYYLPKIILHIGMQRKCALSFVYGTVCI